MTGATAFVDGDDPICSICGDRRSLHVMTDLGPLTHPREARGEGVYVVDQPGYWRGCGPFEDDVYFNPTYKFVPAERMQIPYGHGWSPYP